jgi:hypothetical protein
MNTPLFDELPAKPLTKVQRESLKLLATGKGSTVSISFIGGLGGRNPIIDSINRGYDDLVQLGYALKNDDQYYITDAGRCALKRKGTRE